ncbi:TetR/AcrR family transcriptional regulator [Kordiimonas gwangyangensis]|uniref:TetR/AcrR family transcriptional regulator n=1 Tax=Kordiimonas gwangyangensis TaxID=288022 RepID=UPI0009DD51BA|nr:TetR/AcrR family transcriptional regulator [Kordiimonas gwangyangensis]
MPKPQLSKEKIVDTAIEIADEKGHEAVTLRGIAKRLNVHVTSLYNHVPTKDAVFIEMMKKMLADATCRPGLSRGRTGSGDTPRRSGEWAINIRERFRRFSVAWPRARKQWKQWKPPSQRF